MLGGPENLVGAVYSRLLGDLGGGLLFVLERDAFLQLEACYLALEDQTGLRRLYDRMIDECPEDSQEYLYAKQKRDEL